MRELSVPFETHGSTNKDRSCAFTCTRRGERRKGEEEEEEEEEEEADAVRSVQTHKSRCK